MKRWIYITFAALGFGHFNAQQQTLYTNYLLNPYLYNPAYAGAVEGSQASIGYRNQWTGFDGSPKTYMANGFGNLKKRPKMAIGGLVMTERIGLLQRTTFYGTYTYILKINKKATINFGLGIGGVQHKVRVYDARPYDKDDNFMGSDVLNALAFDANAGFYFYTKNFFLGFSDQQMPNAKIHWDNTNGKNTNHFYATTGYNFVLDSKRDWIIQPSILARTNSPAPYQLEFMAKVLYQEMIWLGLSYRQNSSASFLLGCKINKEIVFGYSYDYTLTDLRNYSSGSHELVLSYLIPLKKKKSKSEMINDADEEELNKIDNSVKTNLRNKKKKEQEQKSDDKPEEKVNPQATEENKTDTTTPDTNGAPQSSAPETIPVNPDNSGNLNSETVKPVEPAAESGAEQQPKTENKPENESSTTQPVEPKDLK